VPWHGRRHGEHIGIERTEIERTEIERTGMR
jgi:hypothetical protein